MSFASRRSWVAVLVVSLLGCSGGSGSGGGGGGAAIDPPAELKAEQGGPFDEVRITWTEPPAEVDGYELEGRMADGPWERMHEGLIERGVTGGWIELDPTIPELTSFAFRIRSAVAARRSDWSAEAAYLRGVRAPTALTAALAEGPAVDLAWSNASAVADALLLERADGNEFGPIGVWSPLPVAFGSTAHRDAAPDELVHQWYRVRYGKGGVWSEAAGAFAGPVPLFAPTALQAALEPGGVRVTWQNRSARATRLVLTRWPGGAPAELSPDATTYLDAASPPWPSSRFWLQALAAGAPPGTEAIASCPLAPFDLAGPAGTLRAFNPPVPWTSAIRRTPAGRFVWSSADGAGNPTISVQTDGGVDVHSLSFRNQLNPLLVVDAAGLPHAVGYTLPQGPGEPPLVHDWLAPDGWRSEVIAGYTGGGSTARFAVDGLGRLQLLENLRHCVVVAGACAMEDVPQPAGWNTVGYAGLEVASDGTALVVTDGYDPARPDTRPFAIATRAPAGGWSVETVPIDGGYNPEPRVVAGPGGDVALLLHRNGAVFQMWYAERRGGVWSEPEHVGPTDFTGHGIAASADLSRVIVHARAGSFSSPDLVMWSRGATGWASATLARGDHYAPTPGVTAAGERWIAAMPNAGGGFGQPQPWSVWEER